MTDGAAPAAAPMTTALTALPVKPKPALPKVTPPSHCHLCGQAVYTTERVPAGGKYYHRRCVRCCVCGVNLSGVHFSWIAYEGSLFCADDVPAKPMRTRVMKSTGWAARSYFDRLSGMSDLMLYIILMLRPPFASFTSQSSYFERYVAWGKQLMALKHANRCFCTPLAKWNNCGVADYAAFLVAKERGAENLLNGRSSGWAQVLASGELDRWEFAEARTLSLAGNDVRSSLFAYANMQAALKRRFGGAIPFVESELRQRAATYCFSGNAMVEMASGMTKRVEDIQSGDVVRTQFGTQAVRHIFKEDISGKCRPLVSLHGFYMTRRHPIFVNGKWWLPKDLYETVEDHGVDAIYNWELADGEASTDHAVWLNGLLVCTLGKAGLPTTKAQDELYGSGYWRNKQRL